MKRDKTQGWTTHNIQGWITHDGTWIGRGHPLGRKLLRKERIARATRAGIATGMVGSGVAAGALASMAAAGAKRDRDYKKKLAAKKAIPVAKAGLGLLAKPVTMNRFKAAGRLTRIKSADTAVRSAGYLGRNATPLVAGATVGGGLSYMATRKKDPMSKGLPSALRPAPGKLVRAMRNPAVRSRIEANTAGRAAGWYASRGMGEDAVQRARIGRNFRFKSSGTFKRIGD